MPNEWIDNVTYVLSQRRRNSMSLTSHHRRSISVDVGMIKQTRLGCGTKSMLTFPAADIIKLYEIISNDALILRQKAD